MAEFDGLDALLRDALGQAGEQGDSTGVADAIRSRVAAGDAGPSVVTGSTAPGWGGGGVLGWLPWLGLVVVAGIGGAALGASGLVGADQQTVVAGYTVVLDDTAPAYACPGGPEVGSLAAGDRVLAVARSEDSAYLGVRDPNAFERVLWFERSVVIVDSGQADVATLPVDACPVVAIEIIPPAAVPVPEVTPDTTPPSIGAIGVQWSNCYFLVTVPVSDDVGVSAVSVSWTGVPGGGSRPMTPQGGGVWRLEVSGSSNVYGGDYTFTVVATDGVGNSSQRVSSPTNIQCLI